MLHRDFGLPLEGMLHAECPHYYRYGWPGETEEQFALRLAGDLERLILREGPDTVGAFIAEPIMGAGGVIMPPASYFELIQAVLDKYEVLLIADEVITAFGRTGKMFGCETYGIRPDIITVAKALSSGYQPIGAVLVERADPRRHAGAEPQDRHLRPRLSRMAAIRSARRWRCGPCRSTSRTTSSPRSPRWRRTSPPGCTRSAAIRWSARRARSA